MAIYQDSSALMGIFAYGNIPRKLGCTWNICIWQYTKKAPDKVGLWRVSYFSPKTWPSSEPPHMFLVSKNRNTSLSSKIPPYLDLSDSLWLGQVVPMTRPREGIRRGNEDNSKIIFLISQRKHMFWSLIRTISIERSQCMFILRNVKYPKIIPVTPSKSETLPASYFNLEV